MPWRRPGFQLGLDIAAIAAANPQAIGCILGGHGITAWGESSGECEDKGQISTHDVILRSNDTPVRADRVKVAHCSFFWRLAFIEL